METQWCYTPRHTPSHACQRRTIDELAYALPDERRGRKRPCLRSENVRLGKQRWKRNVCSTPRHTPSHACQRRKIDELAYALPDERRSRKRPCLRSGNVRLTETKMETQRCSTLRHTPSHACQRRKIDELAYAMSDERRGRKRPYLRSGNVRLRKQRWTRNCDPP